MVTLQGCIPILATPFDAEGVVDETGLRNQVEYLIGNGVHGLATLAIASEGYKLSERERDLVTRTVVETVDRRLPVVVGVDHSGTDIAVERARAALAAGADALMSLPPYFVKPDVANLFRYYRRIAVVVDLPIMVQDAPQLTGVPMPAPFLARLNQEISSIAYVKIEGTPAGPKTAEVLHLTQGRMGVFSGWGGLGFWDGLLRGACGCMPAANFGPVFARVYNLFANGDHQAAQRVFNETVPFVAWSMQSIDLSIWAAKEALVRAGVIQTAMLREPASLPDDVDRAQFEAFLAQTSLP